MRSQLIKLYFIRSWLSSNQDVSRRGRRENASYTARARSPLHVSCQGWRESSQPCHRSPVAAAGGDDLLVKVLLGCLLPKPHCPVVWILVKLLPGHITELPDVPDVPQASAGREKPGGVINRELCTQPWARPPAAHSRCSSCNLPMARGAWGWCTLCPSAWTWRGSHSGAWPGWTSCRSSFLARQVDVDQFWQLKVITSSKLVLVQQLFDEEQGVGGQGVDHRAILSNLSQYRFNKASPGADDRHRWSSSMTCLLQSIWGGRDPAPCRPSRRPTLAAVVSWLIPMILTVMP